MVDQVRQLLGQFSPRLGPSDANWPGCRGKGHTEAEADRGVSPIQLFRGRFGRQFAGKQILQDGVHQYRRCRGRRSSRIDTPAPPSLIPLQSARQILGRIFKVDDAPVSRSCRGGAGV